MASRALALVMLTGCSFTMTTAPVHPSSEEAPACTESVLPPAVDTVVALLSLLPFVPLVHEWAKPECGGSPAYMGYPEDSRCGVIVPATLVVGAVLVATASGAVYGYHAHGTCNAANAAHDEYVAAHPDRRPTASGHAHGPYRWLLPVGIAVAVIVVIVAAAEISAGFHL